MSISALYHPTFFYLHACIHLRQSSQIYLWHFRQIGKIHTQLFRKIYRVWAIKIMRIMWVLWNSWTRRHHCAKWWQVSWDLKSGRWRHNGGRVKNFFRIKFKFYNVSLTFPCNNTIISLDISHEWIFLRMIVGWKSYGTQQRHCKVTECCHWFTYTWIMVL